MRNEMRVVVYLEGSDGLTIETHTSKSPEKLIDSLKKQLALAQTIWPTQLHGTKIDTQLPTVIKMNEQGPKDQ